KVVRDRFHLRIWLYVVCLIIVVMVLVGGATRLTESGLSITEWKPIHGVIPPLNTEEWQEEFQKYQQIPEYQQINKGMSLSEFKYIFWWEWTHRLLGRFIGVVFLIPFLGFLFAGKIERQWTPHLLTLFVLGGLQGAIGWWMVASGLVNRVDVSQYRLAIHLTLACLIFAYALLLARMMKPPQMEGPVRNSVRITAASIVGALCLQIFLGGLVAGLNAGLTFNTWPLMDGQLIPDGLMIMKPAWINFFENVLTVQFQHRLGAYLILLLIIFHLLQCRHVTDRRAIVGAAMLLVLTIIQAAVGIMTLVLSVPFDLALTHQGIAVILLGLSVWHFATISRSRYEYQW
ncbi:MAG: COX15/CtaA family protein, partial [Stappiaceae bacterium]